MMGYTVPNWIERLFGIKTEAGQGTVWGIEYAWPWPPWLTVLFAACAAVFVVAIYLRDHRRHSRPYRLMLAAMRLVLIAMVLLMIAQVTLSLKRTGLPCAAVLVDDSLSMTTVDQYDAKLGKTMGERMRRARLGNAEPSRWNLARTVLTEDRGAWLRGIADGHRLQLYFLTGVRPSRHEDVPGIVKEIRSAAPTGDRTRLGAGIQAVLDELRGTAPAGLVVLSDGINTDGPPLADAAEYARRRGVPLFPIGLGSQQPLRELKLSDLLVDDVVFLNDVVTFDCRLTASGFQGKKVVVSLRAKRQAGRAGQDRSDGRGRRSAPVGSRAVSPHGGRPLRVRRRGPTAGRRTEDRAEPAGRARSRCGRRRFAFCWSRPIPVSSSAISATCSSATK